MTTEEHIEAVAGPTPDPRSVERAIVEGWREASALRAARDLDRATLVACSGGADSSAVAWALASAKPDRVVIATITHDLRPVPETSSDREAVRALAERLGVVFADSKVYVRDLTGNAEANARQARYRALEQLARDHQCRFVATGHQAEDQLETILMALTRGAGPRGLAGMAPSRPLSEGVTLVRPALGVTRAELHALCAARGIAWRHDPTNDDRSRLRARLRGGVVPELMGIRPGLARRLRDHHDRLSAAADEFEAAADELISKARTPDPDRPGLVWHRDALRRCSPGVVGHALRSAAAALADGAGLDAMPWRVVQEAVRIARDASGEPKRAVLGPCELIVTRDHATLQRRGPHPLRDVPQGGPMSEYTGKSVHLVGHCGPDYFMLRNAIERALPGAGVERANSDDELASAKDRSDLLLINRVLDGSFSLESGIELIRKLTASESTVPTMLISNFADAQAEAEAAGAAKGFGKNDTGSPEAAERLRHAIDAPRVGRETA